MGKENSTRLPNLTRRRFLRTGTFTGVSLILPASCKGMIYRSRQGRAKLTPLHAEETLAGLAGRPIDMQAGVQFRAADWTKGTPPWIDLSSAYPTLDPMQVREGSFGAIKCIVDQGHAEEALWEKDGKPGYAATFPDYASAGQWGRLRARHAMAYLRLGRTDNVEVGIVQHMPDWASTFHQCAPIAFVGEHAEPDQVCWLFNYDVSLFKPRQIFYGQNGFAQKPASHFIDYAFYTDTGKAPLTWPTPLAGSSMRMIMRCVDGRIQNILSDGTTTLVSEPYERPAWTAGRDGWGFRSLALWFAEGDHGPSAPDFQGVEQQNQVSLDRILAWWARPYEEPLREPLASSEKETE